MNEIIVVEIVLPVEEVVVGDLMNVDGVWRTITSVNSYRDAGPWELMYEFTTTFTPAFSKRSGSPVLVRRKEENETPL